MLDKPLMPYWGGALLGARKDQQDTFLICNMDGTGDVLAIVADGMGGQAAGGLASQTAAGAFRDAFLNLVGRAGVAIAFEGALDAANKAVDRVQAGHADRQGMGTTLVATYASARGVSWISVGDSPLLLCRDQDVTRLNEDHSLRGLSEFRGGAHGNMLRSALTGEEIAIVDMHAEPLALRPRDVLILASDGLLTLAEAEVVDIVTAPGVGGSEALGQRLLDAVSQKGDPRQDNCTVVTIAVPASAPTRAPAPAAAAPRAPAQPSMNWIVASVVGAAVLVVIAALCAWFW